MRRSFAHYFRLRLSPVIWLNVVYRRVMFCHFNTENAAAAAATTTRKTAAPSTVIAAVKY